jgi:histidinol-phosphate aminotransferase
MVDLSRRGIMGLAAGAGLSTALPARAGLPPGFGPADGVAHLLYNENPYGPSASALAAMADVARRSCYYADDAEVALVDKIAARHGLPRDHVLLGNGSSELLAAAYRAYGMAGAVLAPALTYDEMLLWAQGQGVKVAWQPLLADMGIDLAGMAARAGAGDIGLAYLCNPNNPTGLLLDPAALRRLIAASPVPVLLDEAYTEVTDVPESQAAVDMVKAGHKLLIARTFSKVYGMAGLRVGYMLGRPDLLAPVRAGRGTLGLAAPSLAAAIACYEDAGFLRESHAQIKTARDMIMTAARQHGLRAHTGAATFDIGGLNGGDEPLQGAAEEFVAERAADLVAGHRGVADQETPEAGEGERVPQVGQRDLIPPVALAGEGQHGVRAGFDAPVDETGEVDAQEGEGRVGDGVDEVAHQMLAGRFEHVVLAAEGDDARAAPLASEGGDAVALEAGAVDQKIGFVLAVQDPAGFDGGDGAAGADGGAAGGEQTDHHVTDLRIVDDAFLGNAEGEKPGGVGFDLADLPGRQQAKTGEAILHAALVEIVQAG